MRYLDYHIKVLNTIKGYFLHCKNKDFSILIFREYPRNSMFALFLVRIKVNIALGVVS